MNVRICKRFTFEAAHHLPGYDGPCANLHGHRYELYVYAEGPIDPKTGMVMDFKEIKADVERLVKQLDHSDLNEWLENPTAENLAAHIYMVLSGGDTRYCRVRLYETEDSFVEVAYDGEGDIP